MTTDSAQPQVFRLRGEVEGRAVVFALERGDNTAGSNPRSAVHLPVPKVSRCHATIRVEENQVSLEDLDSKNGSFVNGVRVRKKRLREADWVQFGPVILTLESVAEDEHELAIPVSSHQSEEAEEYCNRELPSTELGLRHGASALWIESLNRCTAILLGGGSPDLAAAVAALAEAAPSCAVALLEWDGRGAVVVRASAGSASLPAELQEPERLLAARPDERNGPVLLASVPLRGESDGAAAVRWQGKTWTHALVALGPGVRHAAPPYLELALRLLLKDSPGPAPYPSHTPADPIEALAFPPEHVVCQSPAMAALYSQIASLCRGASPVLVTGETGVGKEQVVRILHASSDRAGGPLQVVNCAAIPADLLEAELFGIEARVATGVDRRPGKLQLAHGGFLYLDEVGDMATALQAKLLRALQDGEVHPVGSAAPHQVDVRIVAATNANLEAMVRTGAFRKDLYYRITGCELHVPPLRARREDIPPLATHYLESAVRDSGKTVRGLSVKALEALRKAPWPGNVRQLQRELERLVASCPAGQAIESTMISPSALAEGLTDHPTSGTAPSDLDLKRNLATLERRLITQALHRAGGNHSEAARLLGVTRKGLAMKIKRLGIER